jgi:hypothetical protein
MNDEPKMTEMESVVAAAHGVPQKKFKEWRDSGDLVEGKHWCRAGNAFMITAAGQARVLQLIGLEDAAPSPPVPEILVTVMNPGTMNRVLRCKDSAGQMCSVRLTGPRVFARMFRRHEKLSVTATETDGIYEYGGAAPRRTVL